MMTSLKIERTADTYTALARVFAWNKKSEVILEEMGKARANGLVFEERHVMEIVKTLAEMNFYELVPRVSSLVIL